MAVKLGELRYVTPRQAWPDEAADVPRGSSPARWRMRRLNVEAPLFVYNALEIEAMRINRPGDLGAALRLSFSTKDSRWTKRK